MDHIVITSGLCAMLIRTEKQNARQVSPITCAQTLWETLFLLFIFFFLFSCRMDGIMIAIG